MWNQEKKADGTYGKDPSFRLRSSLCVWQTIIVLFNWPINAKGRHVKVLWLHSVDFAGNETLLSSSQQSLRLKDDYYTIKLPINAEGRYVKVPSLHSVDFAGNEYPHYIGQTLPGTKKSTSVCISKSKFEEQSILTQDHQQHEYKKCIIGYW